MDPVQSEIVKNAADIVRNANSQGWAIGMVALFCVVMFMGGGLIVRWLLQREAAVTSEALAREAELKASIKQVDDYTRNTLAGLVTEATVAMKAVARATEGCLARQLLVPNGSVRRDPPAVA